jgi:hypothetical protein
MHNCKQFSRAIRKGTYGAFSLHMQLTLLINWRSVRSKYRMFIHASMIHMQYLLRLNWNK